MTRTLALSLPRSSSADSHADTAAHWHAPAGLKARVGRAVAWSLAGAVASRGLNLAGNVLAARVLLPEGYGRVSMILSTALFASTLAGLGFGLSATKLVAELRVTAQSRLAALVQSTQLSALLLALLCALSFLLFPRLLAASLLAAPELAPSVRAAAALVFFTALGSVQSGVLAGLEEFKALAALNTARSLLGGCAVLAGAKFGGVRGAVLAAGLAEGASVALSSALLHRRGFSLWQRLGRAAFLREVRSVLRFSVPALLASLVTTLAFWLGRRWLSAASDGFLQIGLFEAANKWALAILFLPTTLGAIQLPLLSSLHGARDHASFRKVVWLGVALSVVSCLVPGAAVALLAPNLMSLNGSSYRAGSGILATLALSTLAVSLNGSLGQALIGRGRIWARSLADLLLGLVLIAASSRLVPRFGAAGLARAQALAYASTVLLLLWLLVRRGKPAPGEAPAPAKATEAREAADGLAGSPGRTA